MMSDNEILQRGMECLIKELGYVEAERFAALLIRQSKFDSTEWHQQFVDGIQGFEDLDKLIQETPLEQLEEQLNKNAVRV